MSSQERLLSYATYKALVVGPPSLNAYWLQQTDSSYLVFTVAAGFFAKCIIIANSPEAADFEATLKQSINVVATEDDAFVRGILAIGMPVIEPFTADGLAGRGSLVVERLENAISRGQISGAQSNQNHGFMTVSSTVPAVVRLTAYTEPTSAAQRSLVSSSVNDTAAGTGARKVRITYYDNTMAGPLTEDVIMNGTVAVNTVATNIRFIESMDVIEAGSLSANAGSIDLKSTTGGGGSTVGTILFFITGFIHTLWAHHYIATGKKCLLRYVIAGMRDGTDANVWLRYVNPLSAGPVNLSRGTIYRIDSAGASTTHPLDPPLVIDGPARVDLLVGPDGTTVGTIYGGFGYYEP